MELIDGLDMHEVDADESCECTWAFDVLLICLCGTQEEECDQGDSDLDTQGVFTGSPEVSDSQSLLDPTEE